ncbi:MAG: metallophosphoesterase [Clostridia bacterium]|nr:metallophosphoesterase [Clostridia bacterium]
MSLFFTRPDRYFHLGAFPVPEVKQIQIGGAPEFLKPLRVLFLSDVHLRPGVSNERLTALMELIASQGVDLILLGGDYAESREDCLRFFEAFRGIHAPLGAFAVPGNNDKASMPTLQSTMARAGVTLLNNRSITLAYNGGRIHIGGCDDHKYGSPCTSDLFSDGQDGYRILISHWPVQPDCACELMLSGHTHAGQFNILGITPYSVLFERKFRLLGVKGVQRIGDMRLLISSGIGVSRIPLRIGARPQIYLLNFVMEELC